jgi:hypothetical protein
MDRPLHGALLGGGIVDHGDFGGAQALDLAAQPRGFLEVQVGGGLVQHRLEIVSDADDVVGQRAVADFHQHMVALVDQVKDVADGPASRGGGWSARWRAPSRR